METKLNTGDSRVEVRWVQPLKNDSSSEQIVKPKAIRVAAYCRVSTELEQQTDSFELQESHYTRLICSTPGWRIAGIYADQGITGTQRSQRTGFQRMIRHCKEGKIDRILCKSISRFARNTMDLLDSVRTLKEQNISIIFEKEAIDTLSVQSEFVLSTLAAIAQDESRNISENMIWAFKKRFQSGIPVFRKILGYTIEKSGDDNKIKINKKEAIIVREIYDLALSGVGYTAIARIMMEKGYTTVANRNDWTVDIVKGILTNERYTGDVLCQKSYTVDYLTHKVKRNDGNVQQYLIENHHPAIISHEMFDKLKAQRDRNKRDKGAVNNVYPLSGRVICGECGSNYHRYSLQNDANWRCARGIISHKLCSAKWIRETKLEHNMRKAFGMKYDLTDKNIFNKLRLEIKKVQDNDNVERSRVVLKRKLMVALDNELHASAENLETTIAERSKLEEKLKEQEEFWSALEEDRELRKKTLVWLDKLPRGEGRLTILLEQLNIEYMRAWVMSIKILSPISIIIKWLDDTETRV